MEINLLGWHNPRLCMWKIAVYGNVSPECLLPQQYQPNTPCARNDCLAVACALSVGRIIPRGWCLSGHVVRASSPLKCLDRDCVGRRRTGTRHGDVYRSVREKQGNVVYRQLVLQTVRSLRVVSLVFRGHDLPKITNINPQLEASLSLWKKLVPRESGGNGAKVLVNT